MLKSRNQSSFVSWQLQGLVFLLLMSGGCTTKLVFTTTGGDVHRELSTLREKGEADVQALRQPDHKMEGADPVIERLSMDQQLRFEDARFTLRRLTEGCGLTLPPEGPEEATDDCLLVRYRRLPLFIRKAAQPGAWALYPVLFGSLAVGVGSGLCWKYCEDGSTANTASKVTLISAGVVAGAFVLWEFIKCARGLPCGH